MTPREQQCYRNGAHRVIKSIVNNLQELVDKDKGEQEVTTKQLLEVFKNFSIDVREG